MAVKVKWHPEAFFNQLDANIDKALERTAQILESHAKVNCPVKSGALQASIRHEVDKVEKAAYIGTDLEYGFWVEAGTRKMMPRNYLKDALLDNIIDVEAGFANIQPTKEGEYPQQSKIE